MIGNQRLVIVAVDVPTNSKTAVARYIIQVRWSDTDAYKHTNYLSYVKFCLDAAQDAVANDLYSTFTGDILCYGVRSIDVLYKAESKVNDMLTVSSWQDDSNPYQINFSMHRTDGTNVYQSRIEFYPM